MSANRPMRGNYIQLIPDWMLIPYAVHAYQTGLRTSTVGPILRTLAEQRWLDEYNEDKRALAEWR